MVKDNSRLGGKEMALKDYNNTELMIQLIRNGLTFNGVIDLCREVIQKQDEGKIYWTVNELSGKKEWVKV